MPEYWLTRFCFQRALAVIYLIGFLIAIRQFIPLCGERGLLPVRLLLKRTTFRDRPSLFCLNSSDPAFRVAAWLGFLLAGLALFGVTDAHGTLVSMLSWFVLWALYLSFVNVGQTFYGFGWESLLLEVGFLAIFLGPTDARPPVLIVWLLRWVLFRLMFGAGMIKIRADPCWRDLTCMQYHYETQPMPNPLSRAFHRLPAWVHKASVFFTHYVELPLPFGYFGPQLVRTYSGLVTIAFQVILILSGNLSWLNYITIVVALACFDDSFYRALVPSGIVVPGHAPPTDTWHWLAGDGVSAPLVYGVTLLVAGLSVRPVLNLLSPSQAMNRSFDSLHLVNTYGAFGSVTRIRHEVVIEGTDEPYNHPTAVWKEYGFKGKPSEPERKPPVVSPYHFRLDWQMWFAAMSPYYSHPWILNLVAKLLQGDRAVLGLLRENPFPDKPPKRIRAQWYRYRFAHPDDPDGLWWDRQLIDSYLPPLSLEDEQFTSLLKRQGWL